MAKHNNKSHKGEENTFAAMLCNLLRCVRIVLHNHFFKPHKATKKLSYLCQIVNLFAVFFEGMRGWDEKSWSKLLVTRYSIHKTHNSILKTPYSQLHTHNSTLTPPLAFCYSTIIILAAPARFTGSVMPPKPRAPNSMPALSNTETLAVSNGNNCSSNATVSCCWAIRSDRTSVV